jgi:hypothetical protein
LGGRRRHAGRAPRRIPCLARAATESLEGSPTAEKLQAITEIDLDELLTIDPPRGYGRD